MESEQVYKWSRETPTKPTVPEVQTLALQDLARTYRPLARLRADNEDIGSKSHISWTTNPDNRYCPHWLRGNGSPVQQAFGGAGQMKRRPA